MKIIACFAIASLTLMLGAFPSCSTDTGDAQKDKKARITNAVLEEVFNAVVKVGVSAGASALSGQNGQDVSAAVFQSASTINFGAAIAHVMHEASDPNVNVAPVAKVAAEQFLAANPQTPAEKALVANTIGAALQHVANQQAK